LAFSVSGHHPVGFLLWGDVRQFTREVENLEDERHKSRVAMDAIGPEMLERKSD
jgi:hypothetical protein